MKKKKTHLSSCVRNFSWFFESAACRRSDAGWRPALAHVLFLRIDIGWELGPVACATLRDSGHSASVI